MRAPRVGAVKRRLSSDIGTFKAWRFYKDETARLIAEVRRSRSYDVRLAVTPDIFAVQGRFWASGILRMPQGSGDLGARMARVVYNLPHHPVVIVGSDIPGLGATQVKAAFTALESHDAVLGPALDGGYWLVGFRQRPASPGRWRPALFKDVRWSSPNALQDTVSSFPKSWQVAYLETLRDVDTAADLEAFGRRL